MEYRDDAKEDPLSTPCVYARDTAFANAVMRVRRIWSIWSTRVRYVPHWRVPAQTACM